MQGGGNPATVRPSGTFAVAAAVTPTSVPRRRLPLYAFPSLRIVPASQETTVRRLQPRKQKHSELGRPPPVTGPAGRRRGGPGWSAGRSPWAEPGCSEARGGDVRTPSPERLSLPTLSRGWRGLVCDPERASALTGDGLGRGWTLTGHTPFTGRVSAGAWRRVGLPAARPRPAFQTAWPRRAMWPHGFPRGMVTELPCRQGASGPHREPWGQRRVAEQTVLGAGREADA